MENPALHALKILAALQEIGRLKIILQALSRIVRIFRA
jgi:hypothetical protein